MIRFGIIGCGNISSTYLYVIAQNPNAEVVAVADPVYDAAENKAKQFEISKCYLDYTQMINNESLDAIVVCSPHYVHHDQVLYASARGLHILCEKPLATNLQDVREIIDSSRKVVFSVMLQRRFYPNSTVVRRVIQQEILGEVIEVGLRFSCHKSRTFYNSWRGKKISGGGTVISQALHRIDRLVYFFGPPVAVEGKIKITRDYIEIEDYAKGNIYFKNGVVAAFESDNSSGNPDTISIIKIRGKNGNITLSDDTTLEWNVPGVEVPNIIGMDSIPEEYRPSYYGPCHELVINDFIEAIMFKRRPFVTADDILASMTLIFRFYEAAETGMRVVL